MVTRLVVVRIKHVHASSRNHVTVLFFLRRVLMSLTDTRSPDILKVRVVELHPLERRVALDEVSKGRQGFKSLQPLLSTVL